MKKKYLPLAKYCTSFGKAMFELYKNSFDLQNNKVSKLDTLRRY